MTRRWLPLVLYAILATREVRACSMRSWDENDLVENEIVSSANGRFLAVIRLYDVPDFRNKRAGEVFHLDAEAEQPAEPPPPQPVTVALYELVPGSRRLIAEIPVDPHAWQFFVPDSGRNLVAIRPITGGMCSGYTEKDDPVVMIYATNGALVRRWTASELVDEYDLWSVVHSNANVDYALNHASDTKEQLVLAFTDDKQHERAVRRIDLASATLLDPIASIFPRPRVYVTPASALATIEYRDAPADCAAMFDGAMHIDTERFFAQAIQGPLPEFPMLAIKARIRLNVKVEAVVDEKGRVACVRTTAAPFGLADAAQFVSNWRFTPLVVDGHPVKFAGELLVRFQDVSEEQWAEIVRVSPPME